MAHGNGKSNSERSRSADASSERVTRGEDGQHKHEGDNRLDAEGLAGRDSGARGRQAELVVRTTSRDLLENPGSEQSTC